MEKKFPTVALALVTAGIAALVGIYFKQQSSFESNQQLPKVVQLSPTSTASPTLVSPTLGSPTSDSPTSGSPISGSPILSATERINGEAAISSDTPPQPTPPPLNESDAYIVAKFSENPDWSAVVSILTKEEIIRKIVRAVYGLKEGRVVREYRPISSPKEKMLANKIGQQNDAQQELFRISSENHTRYTPFISLFSLLNNETAIDLYRFYSPLFEQAYKELGTGDGSFHSTLLEAVDVMLTAPEIDSAMLLVQPSVAYKFDDPNLEKLPPAHKLMLRMGQENSEVLKLELKKFKTLLSESGLR